MTHEVDVQYETPSTGNTVQANDWTELLSLNPASGLATLTVNFPKNPRPKQPFKICSSQAVTTATLQATSGGSSPTIIGAPSALVAGVVYAWTWQGFMNTWVLGA